MQQSFEIAHIPLAGFRTITADPGWRYGDPGIRGGTKRHYESMALDEIAALPVRGIAAAESHLYLWTTNAFLADGSAGMVCRAWGFRPITVVTWVKPRIGTGHYFRNTTEHFIFGVRGTLAVRGIRNTPTHFMADVAEHSRKPDAFYGIVEKMSHAPALELFARGPAPRPGWFVWGKEAEGALVLPGFPVPAAT